jgi:hypothetical protein
MAQGDIVMNGRLTGDVQYMTVEFARTPGKLPARRTGQSSQVKRQARQ